MTPNSNRFLAALAGTEGPPVLFEPFVPTYLAEQLIWRRGAHLWETVPAYLETLVSLQERTYADVIIADMRSFVDPAAAEMGDCMAKLATDELRFVTLCDSPTQLQAAMASAGVCGAGLYGWQEWARNPRIYNKEGNRAFPLIAMDGDCQAAAEAGFDGWFCPAHGEEMWRKVWSGGEKSIAICGGLGVDWLRENQPVTIHNRCENIFRETNGAGFLVGSGGAVSAEDYLSLISLLGIYRRWR